MAEVQIKLKGWQAVAAMVLVIALVIVRFSTFKDKTGDANLMREIKVQLMSDYFPREVAKLSAAVKSGNKDKITRVAESVTSAKAKIESVRISAPLLNFSTSKDVVVEVVYSLEDQSGTRDRKTKYYLFSHGTIGNTWSYRYESSRLHYYLNFK